MRTVELTGHDLRIEDVVAVARGEARVRIAPEARQRVREGFALLMELVERGVAVYGITTGFGALDRRRVRPEDTSVLQHNLIVSHAAGTGPSHATEIVRAMMCLRANVLAQGVTGVREEVLDLLVEMLNRGVHPVVPEQGSVGASGDLAPLAHMVLPMIGLGRAEWQGEILDGTEALFRAGLRPCTLAGRDGIALINGTEQASAVACLVIAEAVELARTADVAAAMSAEALLSLASFADPAVHARKPHPGQAASACNLHRILSGSGWAAEAERRKLRDPLSIRCTPQVHGALRDALGWAHRVVEIEINSANDNPLVFLDEGRVNSNSGNFHGQHVGMVLDLLSAALTSLAVISERRVARLVDERLNEGLPAFLVLPPTGEEGMHNGLMLAQYTAAYLVAESRALCTPGAVQSIPTCANSEDHVSMATVSARKTWQILHDATGVLAIELLAAAQALELRGIGRCAAATRAAWAAVRARIPTLDRDRVVAEDIQGVTSLVRSRAVLRAVEDRIGRLA